MGKLFNVSHLSMPLESTQLDRQDIFTINDVALSGMVFCPQRFAHISTMRCGEYQQLYKCGATCPNAATKQQIRAVTALMRAAIDKEESWSAIQKAASRHRLNGKKPKHPSGPKLCIDCGSSAKSPKSQRCRSCGAKRAAGARYNRVRYSRCQTCRRLKLPTTRRNCVACARKFKAAAIMRELQIEGPRPGIYTCKSCGGPKKRAESAECARCARRRIWDKYYRRGAYSRRACLRRRGRQAEAVE